MALNVETFVKEIESMSVLELNGLVKALEEKFGVSAAMMAAPAAAGAAPAAGAAAAEEQTEFTVVLKEAGANKINVIKAVREVNLPRPQGSEGSRREPRNRQGRRVQGRGGLHQEEVRGRGREGGNQVVAERERGDRGFSSIKGRFPAIRPAWLPLEVGGGPPVTLSRQILLSSLSFRRPPVPPVTQGLEQ